MFDVPRSAPPAQRFDLFSPSSPAEDPVSHTKRPEEIDAEKRHHTLMQCLHDEGERQAEERYQMAIDEDYNDHLHWRPEDAAVLQGRGQAPLVFNEGRQTIEWISGSEKRMRKDFKVLPREPEDEKGAEIKQALLKYTDDTNMTQWHRSAAFKQMAVCGLSWLEEGLNHDPEQDIIYSGKEDWRNVLRDSRARDIMQRDDRYRFRKKRLDLDYATALLGSIAKDRLSYLTQEAYRVVDDNHLPGDPWYLGERLTGASDIGGPLRVASSFDERDAFIMNANGYNDVGRRMSVDIIESWYRVPEAVRVFSGGQFDGQIYNPQDPRHEFMVRRRSEVLRDAVRMRMRVMLSTKDHYLWDGPSPYSHGQFLLVPLIAYRRARDGMIYGAWRGMRDLSDDTNKRRAKALWAVSSTRLIINHESLTEDQDIDMVRQEGARVDGVLVVKGANGKIDFVKNEADVQGNLAMAEMNVNAMRNIGGVTSENLGMNTSAQSGKAILAKQDQGSLTTSDLFDNYQLAIKMQGRLRLSHIQQFYTHAKALRIIGKGTPFEWLKLNEFDPETGEFKNDVTQGQADFEVDTQDFRSAAGQAALEYMFNLLGQIAPMAPQVVLNVLDLVVQSADLPMKDEWVARIRAINGQRDPNKAPTPEEMTAAAKKQQEEAEANEMVKLMGQLEIKLKEATVNEKDAGTTLKIVDAAMKRVSSMYQALEAGNVVTTAPHIVPAADAITEAAGLGDMSTPPNVPIQAALPAPDAALAPEQAPAGEVPLPVPQDAGLQGGMPPMPGEAEPAVSG